MRVGGLSALLLCVWAVTVSGSGLVNTNVIRTVDLQKLPFVHEQVGVVVQNDHHSKVFKTYTISIPLDKAPKLSQVSVHERKSGDALKVTKEGVSQDTLLYRVALRRGLQPGEKLSLNIDLLFVSLVAPQPKAVAQSDDQSWLWDDRARVTSLYPTRKQKTVVKTRGDVLRFTKENAAKDARTVVFGPFTDDAEGRVQVAIRDNSEQMEAVTHRREYFVSHWADDLNVLEHYALRNLGPELSGGFDKVDQMVSKYMRRRDNLVKTLLVKVPEDARAMYFVDEIGNVSTSAVTGRRRPKKGEDEPFKILQLKPRFPLPGGWNYTWWHGYSVPLHRYLKISDGRHLLRLPFIGSLAACASQEGELTVAMANAQNTAVRAYELRVTLPEGARDISVQLPVAGEPLLVPTKYYFDSVGRTVVVITHANVAPELASRHILVSYSYAPLALWLKPAVVAAALFALFMLASVASRMQYGLTPKRPAAKSKAAKKQSGKVE